jgi:hypothetical protein
MLADLALKQAGNEMVGANVVRGLVIIYRDANRAEDDENVCLFFVARDKWGYDQRNLMFVGLYDDLDTAVTIASIGYGVSEAAWQPLEDFSAVNLPLLSQAVKEYELDEK